MADKLKVWGRELNRRNHSNVKGIREFEEGDIGEGGTVPPQNPDPSTNNGGGNSCASTVSTQEPEPPTNIGGGNSCAYTIPMQELDAPITVGREFCGPTMPSQEPEPPVNEYGRNFCASAISMVDGSTGGNWW